MSEPACIDTERRFGGLERLYGPSGRAKLAAAHIAVAGIGGVGSWCVEALARSGVGGLTLIDLDHISESNINRQLHAMTDTLGMSKVEAMARRVRGINPGCRVAMVDDFVSAENVQGMLASDLTVLIDCTDQVSAKIAMILATRQRGIPVVVCGGAGGKTRPLSLRAGDLSLALNDALLAKLRNTLRRRHRYPKASGSGGKPLKRVPRMGVRALWFDQPVLLPEQWLQPAADPLAAAPDVKQIADHLAFDPDTQYAIGQALQEAGSAALQGLSCAGYGSVVTVTAAMGMAAADEAMQWTLNGRFA